jgi:hypothetical protein
MNEEWEDFFLSVALGFCMGILFMLPFICKFLIENGL